MSVSYWAVSGFGINVEGQIFDLGKVVNLLNFNEEDILKRL